MKQKKLNSTTYISEEDRQRRKRELIIILIIIVVVALLTYAESRVIHLGSDFPVSNAILMFILININLLLLILLIFLVFRNLVKLLYDRKRRVMGAKLRTKLVVAFISLTLLPTIVLFFFSLKFITTSIEFWFNAPIETALENSLKVGRRVYHHIELTNQFFLERASLQIKKKKLLESKNKKALVRYIQIVQRAFNMQAVEVYSLNSKRLSFAISPELEKRPFSVISADTLHQEITPANVRSISERIPGGELFRTIGTVPFGVKQQDAKAFIVLTTLITQDLSENMRSISRGVEQYQQIKLLRDPIQVSYYITLSIVALLVVFCAVWFGFYLAKTISIPIMELAEGTLKVAEGDLNVSIPHVADDEMGSLVESFNKMTKDLKTGREQLELSTQMLQERNVEIDNRRRYMEIVLRNVSAGVLTLDADGNIASVNKSAEKMLKLKSDEIYKKNYQDLIKGQHLKLADEIKENLTTARDNALEVPLRLIIEGRPRSFLIHVTALKDDEGNHMGTVMVFDDFTELEKAQRMVAWREVARRIAHEVKNPLTPITLSAQRLKRKYSEKIDESVFEECTRTIIDHVDIIRNLVNEFSSFARFPTANPAPCLLPPIIEETLAFYQDGHRNITFETRISESIPRLSLDRQQIKQALNNLVDNAIAAITDKGAIAITLTHDPILGMVRLVVADDGEGISDEDKTRLFEPNFSTKKAGMGLGLTIVSTIVTDHDGMISVQDNQPRGARFVIELPVK